MNRISLILTACVVGLFALQVDRQALAGPRTYFSSADGIAIHGFDPVAFHTLGEPTRGAQEHALEWKGVVWLFVTRDNQVRFEMNPRAYAPQFGGHCAYGVANGAVATADPMSWEIVDGRLYFFHNEAVEARWREQSTRLIEIAHESWPTLIRRR